MTPEDDCWMPHRCDGTARALLPPPRPAGGERRGAEDAPLFALQAAVKPGAMVDVDVGELLLHGSRCSLLSACPWRTTSRHEAQPAVPQPAKVAGLHFPTVLAGNLHLHLNNAMVSCPVLCWALPPCTAHSPWCPLQEAAAPAAGLLPGHVCLPCRPAAGRAGPAGHPRSTLLDNQDADGHRGAAAADSPRRQHV